jgi:hypothetical protein
MNMKSLMRRYPVLAAYSLGLLLLPTGCYQMSVTIEPNELESSSESKSEISQQQAIESSSVLPEKAVAASVSTSAPTSTNQAESSVVTDQVMTYHQNSDNLSGDQGLLRMSNQTEQPVRVALLARRSTTEGGSSMPAHWDFAPSEGSEKGLILSLPNGKFKLGKGDILVAFAQDGSRRYWGPYVVGETSLPKWNPQQREWQLIISP